jgi:hypothetical protein
VTDASDYAVGVLLEKADENGQRRPCLFFSHSSNSAERHPVHERELLAIVLALRTWRSFLLGSEFSVICQTDHKPLQAFMLQPNLSPRQVRWQAFMSEYILQVSYVPGNDNDFADGLSRRPDLRLMVVGALAPYDPGLKRINHAVAVNAEVQKLRKQALQRSGAVSKTDGFVLQHGVLFYNNKGLLKVYVPKQDSLRIAFSVHFMIYPSQAILAGEKHSCPSTALLLVQHDIRRALVCH